MMKIVGTAIVSISVILTALSFYEKYRARPKNLEMFSELISAYLTELKWRRGALKDILLSIKAESTYIKECQTLLLTQNVYDAMINCNTSYKNLHLSDDDKLIIEHFFKNSGKTSYKNELELCQKTVAALDAQKNDAISKFKKIAPLYIKLGLIAAVWIVIILI